MYLKIILLLWELVPKNLGIYLCKVGIIYIIAAIFGFFARENYVLFYISTFLTTMAMAVNQLLSITKEKTKLILMDYDTIMAQLPKGVELAYDGMKISV